MLEFGDSFLMPLSFDEVIYIVEVLFVVKEFFGNTRLEKPTGDFIRFTLTMVLLCLLYTSPSPRDS